MSTKFPVLSTLTIATAFFLASCGGNGGKNENDISTLNVSDKIRNKRIADATNILPEWSKENIVVNHWPGDPDNLHPTNGGTAARSWILQLTANYILRNDVINLNVCPDLAEAMPEVSDDNLRYTYTLRKNATWDDGSAITAEDCVFMLKANRCPLTNNPITKSYFENIQDVITYPDNAYKFTIVMKQEEINNINFLSDYPVFQRKYFDPNNVLAKYTFAQFNNPDFNTDNEKDLLAWANKFNDAALGNDISLLNYSGAYKVAEWTRGQNLILERKKNHWTQKLSDPNEYETSFPEKIIFKIIKDPTAQKLEFGSQALDASVWLSTATATELMDGGNFLTHYNIEFTDNYSYNYIGLNMKPDGVTHKKFFDDVKVRRAMGYLVPVDDLINVITLGRAKRMAGPISPLKDEYNTNLTPLSNDIAAATKLLDEAGSKDSDGDNIRDKMIDGVKTKMQIEFKYQAGQTFVEETAIMIKEAVYKGGIELILIPIEGNTLKEHLQKHDFDMYMSAWAGGSLPEEFTQLWHTKSYSTGGSNYVGFGNSETDALIDQIKVTMDSEKRIPLSQKMQQIIYDEQPYIFMYSAYRKNIIHKRFGNQIMTFDRPGNILNNLRLIALYGAQSGSVTNATESNQ